MYFFRLKKLLAELQAEPANDSRTFKYFFASTVLISLPIILNIAKPQHHSIQFIGLFIAALTVKLIGILYCYKVNGGKNGKYFFHRFFPIAWVLFFRLALPLLLLLLMLAAIILNILGINVALLSQTDTNTILAFTTFITTIVLWWRVAMNIKILTTLI